MDSVRDLLRHFKENEGISYKRMSEEIGRNHAYIQQFVERGSPETLPEDVRETLAIFLGVDAGIFKVAGRTRAPRAGARPELVYTSDDDVEPGAADGIAYKGRMARSSPEVDARVGAGRGQLGAEVAVEGWSGHRVVDEWVIAPTFLQEVRGTPGMIWVLPVIGNSMEPLFTANDRVMVDTTHRVAKPDGVYVIDNGHGPEVKELQIVRGSSPPRVRIISVNPSFKPETQPLDEVRVIGRVCGRISKM
jgi:hypothetical protein